MTNINLTPIIEAMLWSYSRVKSFGDCRYKWYLRYILKKPQKDMFFASYGSFVHSLLEKYYKGELTKSQLLPEYLMGFRKNVKGSAPNKKIFQSYFQAGKKYFQDFEPLPYKVLEIEKKIEAQINGVRFTGIVDWLGETDDGLVLIDNKSRTLKQRSGRAKPTKADEELDEYYRQLYLYAIAVQKEYGKPVRLIGFNCFRNENSLILEEYDPTKEALAVQWLTESVSGIIGEKDFKPDMDYFRCKNLCEMNAYCEYYKLMKWK